MPGYLILDYALIPIAGWKRSRSKMSGASAASSLSGAECEELSMPVSSVKCPLNVCALRPVLWECDFRENCKGMPAYRLI